MIPELVTYYMHRLYHQVEKMKREDYDPGQIALYSAGYKQALLDNAARAFLPSHLHLFQFELHRQMGDLANNWQEPKITIAIL